MATAIIGKVVSKKGSAPAKAAKGKKPKAAKVESESKQTPVEAWVLKFRPNTIGRQIAELIVKGDMSNEEICKAVKDKHKSDTTIACVSWYKSKARKAGILK